MKAKIVVVIILASIVVICLMKALNVSPPSSNPIKVASRSSVVLELVGSQEGPLLKNEEKIEIATMGSTSFACPSPKAPPKSPGFFVLAPPYGGGPSLEQLLQDHPVITPAAAPQIERRFRRTQLSFFDEYGEGSGGNGTERLRGMAWYKSHFGDDPNKVYYDFSATYLTGPGGPAVVPKFFPHAKAIVVVSHPVHSAYQYLNHTRHTAFDPRVKEPQTDHWKARVDADKYLRCLRAQPMGMFIDGKAICQYKSFLQAHTYAVHISRWAKAVGNKKLLVLFEEEMVNQPAEALRKVEEFLCLSPTGRTPTLRQPPVPEVPRELKEDLSAYYHNVPAALSRVLNIPITSVPWVEAGYKVRVLGMNNSFINPAPELDSVPVEEKPYTSIRTFSDMSTRNCSDLSLPYFLCDGNVVSKRSNPRCESIGNRAFAPSLFLIGAQKCASSTLAALMNHHPNLVGTRIKELQLFAQGYGASESQFTNKYLGARSEGFAKFFREFENVHRHRSSPVVGFDASVTYLSGPGASRDVSTFFPNSKAIAILCDPVQRAYSMWRMWYSQALVAYTHPIGERLQIFEKRNKADPFLGALLTEKEEYEVCMAERPLGMFRDDEEFCESRSIFLHRGFYARQLRRWARHLGSDNILVLFKTDIKKQPREVIRAIETFLCLPEGGTAAIPEDKLLERRNVDPAKCNSTNKDECSPNHWHESVRQGMTPMSKEARELLQATLSPEDADLKALLKMNRLPWEA